MKRNGIEGKGRWHERVLAKHRTCAYVSQENENQSSVVRKEDGELETCARRGLWPSCLRISLARENQSIVVRLTSGGFVCLCFLSWMTLMFLHRCYCSLRGGLRVTVLQLNTKKRILYVEENWR